MRDPETERSDDADDSFGWTDEPGDPDAVGPAAEFVGSAEETPGVRSGPTDGRAEPGEGAPKG